MAWPYWVIGILFICVPVFLYGGLIVSHSDNYRNKKSYYVRAFIVLIMIGLGVFLIDGGYVDDFLNSILHSDTEYTPGECFPYGSCGEPIE